MTPTPEALAYADRTITQTTQAIRETHAAIEATAAESMRRRDEAFAALAEQPWNRAGVES